VYTTTLDSSDPIVVGTLASGFGLLVIFAAYETFAPLKQPLTPTRIFTAGKGRELTAPFVAGFVVTMFYVSISPNEASKAKLTEELVRDQYHLSDHDFGLLHHRNNRLPIRHYSDTAPEPGSDIRRGLVDLLWIENWTLEVDFDGQCQYHGHLWYVCILHLHGIGLVLILHRCSSGARNSRQEGHDDCICLPRRDWFRLGPILEVCNLAIEL
jgi:hypothetical protein